MWSDWAGSEPDVRLHSDGSLQSKVHQGLWKWQAEALAALEEGDRAELRGTRTNTSSKDAVGNEIVANLKETSEQICCYENKQQKNPKQTNNENLKLSLVKNGLNKSTVASTSANIRAIFRRGSGKLLSLSWRLRLKSVSFKRVKQNAKGIQTKTKNLGLVNQKVTWLLLPVCLFSVWTRPQWPCDTVLMLTSKDIEILSC